MIHKGDAKQPGPAVKITLQFGEPMPKDARPPDPTVPRLVARTTEYSVTEYSRTGPGVTVTVRDGEPLDSKNKTRFYGDSKTTYYIDNSVKVMPPPGSLLRSIADFLCSIGTMTNVVEPAIADMQFEVFEALKANRRQKARWVLIRGYWGVILAIGLVQTLRRVRQILKF